jgi:histidyl-tRNA synthetase
VEYEVNPRLVRGLDYYVETVFEIVAGELGAQNSIGGGGRYDGLLKQLGGPDRPCIGFATGIERVILTLLKQEAAPLRPSGPLLFLIGLDEASKNDCFLLLHQLRQNGISAEMDFGGKKLQKAMQYANTIGAQNVVVIGENERTAGIVDLKNMASGTSKKVPLQQLSQVLKLEQKNHQFLALWNELSQPFEESSQADFFAKELENSINQTKEIVDHLHEALEKIQKIVD